MMHARLCGVSAVSIALPMSFLQLWPSQAYAAFFFVLPGHLRQLSISLASHSHGLLLECHKESRRHKHASTDGAFFAV